MARTVRLEDLLPPLPKKTKVVDVGQYYQTGQVKEFILDATVAQSQKDLLTLLKKVTAYGIARQIELDNPPTRVLIDGVDGKSLDSVRKKTDTWFGQHINQVLITNVERTLRKMILRNTRPQTGNLSDMRNWQWLFIPKGTGAGTKAIEVDPRRSDFFWYYGDRLILVPKRVRNSRDGANYATMVNAIVAREGQDFTPSRGKNKGVTRRNNYGFARQTTQKLKSVARFSGVTIHAGFTVRHAEPNEIWRPSERDRRTGKVGKRLPPRTLYISLTNRAKRTTGRGYRRFIQ